MLSYIVFEGKYQNLCLGQFSSLFKWLFITTTFENSNRKINIIKKRTGLIIYEPAIPYQKTCYGDKAWAIPDLTMGGWTYSEQNCERGHWKRKDMYSVLGQDFITSVPKRYTCPYVYSHHVRIFSSTHRWILKRPCFVAVTNFLIWYGWFINDWHSPFLMTYIKCN